MWGFDDRPWFEGLNGFGSPSVWQYEMSREVSDSTPKSSNFKSQTPFLPRISHAAQGNAESLTMFPDLPAGVLLLKQF